MSILLASVTGGVTLGYSSSVSAQLLLPDFILAFFSSVINLGALIGSLFVGPLLTFKGRRATLCFSTLPALLGWFMICSAQGLSPPSEPTNSLIALLLLGRILTGVAAGMLLATASVFLVEVAPPSQRGQFGSFAQFGIVAGICIAYAFGMYTTWYETAKLMLLPTAGLFALSFYLPESPVWLFRNGNLKLALTNLSWLRGDHSAAVDELSASVATNHSEGADCQLGLVPLLFPCTAVLPELRSRLRMAINLMVFQQLTGVNVITFYTEPLCQKFAPISQSARCAFSLGLAQLVFSLIACLFIDRFPRRVLMLSTGVIMSVSLILFAFGQQFPAATPVSPIVALIFFLFGYCCGWGPLAMLITLELFPVSQRGPAGGAAVATSWIASYVVTQSCKPLINLFGEFFTFLSYALLTVAGSVYFMRHLPETNQACLSFRAPPPIPV
ncbi:hypothetical protein AAHC03_0488 [Spirometra sp. Aus1]